MLAAQSQGKTYHLDRSINHSTRRRPLIRAQSHSSETQTTTHHSSIHLSTETQQPTSSTSWVTKQIQLPPFSRGCHVITRQLLQHTPEISEFDVGLAHFFIQHTSASLTINENASPDVPKDLADALDRLAPEGTQFAYRHDEEGPDDMPSHIKSSLMGPGLTIPIAYGKLAMGVWQGIYLNEHRNYGGPRQIVVTIQGQKRADGRKYSSYS